MLKMFATIGLVAAIATAPVAFTPMTAKAQAMARSAVVGASEPTMILVKTKAVVEKCIAEANAKGLRNKTRQKFLGKCEKQSTNIEH